MLLNLHGMRSTILEGVVKKILQINFQQTISPGVKIRLQNVLMPLFLIQQVFLFFLEKVLIAIKLLMMAYF